MLSAPKDLRDKIVAPESAAAEAMLAAGTASALEVTSLALLCGRGNLARSGLKPGRKFHNPFSLPVGVWHADATSLGDQIERFVGLRAQADQRAARNDGRAPDARA